MRARGRPGLTGLAQIDGRNSADWDRRLKNDIRYVDHLSPALDLRILLATCKNVLRDEGVAVLPPLDQVRLAAARRSATDPG